MLSATIARITNTQTNVSTARRDMHAVLGAAPGGGENMVNVGYGVNAPSADVINMFEVRIHWFRQNVPLIILVPLFPICFCVLPFCSRS